MTIVKASVSLSGVRQPRQERGRRTRERLLNAAGELFAERGGSGLTLAEVARRAGVANGSAYWLFDSKEALIRALHERLIGDLETELRVFDDLADWSQLGLRSCLARAIHTITTAVTRQDALLKAFVLHAHYDEEAASRGMESVEGVRGQFVRLMLGHRGEISHANPEMAVDVCFRTIWAGLSQEMSPPALRLGDRADWPQYSTELASLCVAYLTNSGGAPSAAGERGH
jgi:AcrR family transcriptional regulator